MGVSRVINKDGEFTTGSTAGAIQNGINHATHVSGTMVGNGTNNLSSINKSRKIVGKKKK
ncbi:hypothetical protein EG240_13325 [Paenimyroides tangerinum]|uniref:Uncharacterized protein n=1 Tax=Paenimyroides tangerinum TaxID=2488728 RepID=A0A3P3W4R4_9FLAO|nr:hypothetical protein [Paenimyroides tangerinum]RRJ88926.1 hypothetical protein EG240_13325 [Paenimyroides tangerinum]